MTPEELEPVSPLAARLLSALANQKRLLVMAHLFQGEMSVNTLAQKVNLSRAVAAFGQAPRRRHRLNTP